MRLYIASKVLNAIPKIAKITIARIADTNVAEAKFSLLLLDEFIQLPFCFEFCFIKGRF